VGKKRLWFTDAGRRQAERGSYRRCKPPTSGSPTTSPVSGDITARDAGRVLADRQMRARAMVVGEVGCEDSPRMALAEHDHMVETLAADRADKALNEGVLPGRVRGAQGFLDAHSCESVAAEGEILEGERAAGSERGHGYRKYGRQEREHRGDLSVRATPRSPRKRQKSRLDRVLANDRATSALQNRIVLCRDDFLYRTLIRPDGVIRTTSPSDG